jgi:hypothetical protein
MIIDKITMIKFARKFAQLKGKSTSLRHMVLTVNLILQTPCEDDLDNLVRIAKLISRANFGEIADALVLIDNEKKLVNNS